MKLAVGIIIKQLLLDVHDDSLCEASIHAGVYSCESLFAMSDDKIRARFTLVGNHVFLRCHVTVTVCVCVRIRATIKHVNKQVPLVVVQ